MARSFETHARTVTLLTFLSRIGGLLRDAVMSRVFGAGAAMDAFAFAFLVPNLFRRLFGEGALSAALLPAYTLWSERDPAVAARLAWIVIGRTMLLLGGIVLLSEVVLAILLAWGDGPSTSLWLLAAMLPYAPLICLTALLGSMLQVHHRFGPTAASPLLLNLLLVGAALLAWRLDGGGAQGIRLVAVAVLLAGAAQAAWSAWALHRVGALRRGVRTAEASAAAAGVGRMALPMILGLGVLQVNGLVDGVIASWPTLVGPTVLGVEYPLEQGAMALLGWAQRLYEFPLGVFGIAVATAIFPALSRLGGDPAEFAAVLRRGIRLVLFMGLPASVGLMLVAEPLVAVVLEGGAFTAEDTRLAAWILLGYAPAVWAYSLNQVLVRAFYARGDSMTPVRVAMALVVLNLILNLTLIWTPLRTAGLAWSTAICAVVQGVVLWWILSRRGVAEGGLLDRPMLRSALASLLLAIAMALLLLAADQLLPFAASWWGQVLRLGALVGLGGVVVGGGAVLLRMPEWRWVLGRGERPRVPPRSE